MTREPNVKGGINNPDKTAIQTKRTDGFLCNAVELSGMLYGFGPLTVDSSMVVCGAL